MINLVNLNKQHTRIKEEVNLLESEIKKGIAGMNTSEAALHINYLAGQLNVHLLEEDEFLYPNLLKSADEEIKKMAGEYLKEMGDLISKYTDFKSSYNIGNKINNNKEKFLEDVQIILKALKDRISKEDKELYYLIQSKNL